jgi:hypothetical protein
MEGAWFVVPKNSLSSEEKIGDSVRDRRGFLQSDKISPLVAVCGGGSLELGPRVRYGAPKKPASG